jgi:hypothetical protein
MERSDERLSTRDIASPGSDTEPETAVSESERDAALADAPPAHTGAVPPDRADRETDAADRPFDADRDADVVTDEPTSARGPSPESTAEPVGTPDAGPGDTGAATAPAAAPPAATPAAASAAMSGTADEPGDGGGATAAGATSAETTSTTSDAGATAAGAAETRGEPGPLLPDADSYQSRWEEIQVRFVDEPRGAVEDADALVATVMQKLAEGFAQERERLEAQWGRGEDISTEDLRVALQRYRSFFQRLLST